MRRLIILVVLCLLVAGVSAAAPVAKFKVDPVTGEAPLDVKCIDTSGDKNIVKWLWAFGDDTTSKEQETAHTYKEPGEYTVTLTVTNDKDESASDTVLVTVLKPKVPVSDGRVNITTGANTKDKTTATLTAGEVTFASEDFSAKTTTLINDVKFVPVITKTDKGTLTWGTGEAEPVVEFVYQYTGATLKEAIILKEDKVLKFPVVIDEGSHLIPWFNGQWKVVSKTSGNTMAGIVLEKPYGIDANDNRIEMEYTYGDGVLSLNYNRTITKYEKDVPEQLNIRGLPTLHPVYSQITYPLVIDPTWVVVDDRWEDATSVPGYTLIMWNTTGTTTWTPPVGVTEVDYIVVAGGGSSGGAGSPGGAGGVLTGSGLSVTGDQTVTVGAGAAAGASGNNAGAKGDNSVFGSTLTSVGGGYGGSQGGVGGPGGSGGSSGWTSNTNALGTAGPPRQGYDGGASFGAGADSTAGGGGAGQVGGAITAGVVQGGDGGNGLDGTALWWGSVIPQDASYPGWIGGGGGGGSYTGGIRGGYGGKGGGGSGSLHDTATAGVDGLGGGGGANVIDTSHAGTKGGSGIVIIRYATALPPSPATFTSNTTLGYQYPYVVKFTDTTTASVTTHNWTFGDTYTSTLANPVHIYHPAGNYTVNMNVTFDDGTFGENTSYVELRTDDDIWLKSWLQFENATVVGLKGIPWTAVDGAAVSAAQKKFGAQSLAITTSDARIYTAPSAQWDWGLANAEMEFWIRPVTNVADKNLISRTSGGNAGTGTATGWGLRSNASGTGYYWWMGTTASKTPDFALTAGTWTHIKIERDGSDVEIYKNGVILSDTSLPGVFDTANSVVIGYKAGGTECTFYLDEFRFTNGISREVGAFDVPYAAYRGNLYTNYVNINPNATLRYKTDPSFPSNAIVYNATPRYRTVQIQNLTNATYVSGKLNFEPGSMFAQTVTLNSTVYADMVLESYSIDNNNGIVNFNVSRAAGIKALFNNRTDLIDVPMLYWKYSTDTDVYSFFALGNLIDGEHNAAYPIFNFIGTNVTLGMWGKPVIDFSADDTTPAMLQTVTFTDASTNFPDSYAWDFGDGGTSTLKNPTYAYTSMGTFNVTLHAYLAANTSITNTSTKVNYITVGAIPPPAPVANFVGAPLNVALGNPVQYNDTSTNSPTSWLWSFGDGGGSTNQNPSHVFAAVGNYTINLTATNPTGSNLTSKYNYTQVSVSGGSGFTQQDLIMSPQYTLTATFVDSVTLLPIPVVSVMDSTSYNTTTTTGVFTHTYPYSVVVLYASSTGYTSRSASYVVDADRAVTIPMVKAVEDSASATLNSLYPKEVTIRFLDRYGNPQKNVSIVAVMSSSTVSNTNWVQTLFGVSSDATSMQNTTLTGVTDDIGQVIFPMISSGRYTVTATKAADGIASTTILYPSQSQYTIIVATTATPTVLLRSDYVNASLFVTTYVPATTWLNFSYNDTSHSTTSLTFYVDASNATRLYTNTVTGVSLYNNSYAAANVKLTGYVWGYFALTPAWGNTSEALGITMKGATDTMLMNLAPCTDARGIPYATGWGNTC